MHILNVPRQNVPRDNTSQETKRPRDKNVPGTKRPISQTSQGDKGGPLSNMCGQLPNPIGLRKKE